MDLASRVVVGAALARDSATGRFIGTDGRGRSDAERRVIASRRAEVAKLYPDKTPAEIGIELGWAKPTIDKDVGWLVEYGLVERQRSGPRRKYPQPEPRPCAYCGEDFVPESWNVAAGWGQYCSIPHARSHQTTDRVRATARELKTQQRRRADGEIARLNAAGYLTSRQVAAKRKVTESAVSRYIAVGLLKAERRIIEGEPHQLIRREELERFNVEDWPRILERMGLRHSYPANWDRPACLRWTGRKGGHKGAAAGLEATQAGKNDGRPPLATPEQQRRMSELDKAGKRPRDIAEEVFGERRLYKRVERFLAR